MKWFTISELRKIIKEVELRNHTLITFDCRVQNKEAFSRKDENDNYWELIDLS